MSPSCETVSRTKSYLNLMSLKQLIYTETHLQSDRTDMPILNNPPVYTGSVTAHVLLTLYTHKVYFLPFYFHNYSDCVLCSECC